MRKTRRRCILALAGILTVPALTGTAQDQTDLSVLADLAEPGDGRVPLYLEVSVNGRPTNLVAEFALDQGTGRMFAPRSELAELGVRAPRGAGGVVDLQAIPGVQFSYDETAQKIDLRVPLAALHREVDSAMPEAEVLDPVRSYGAVLNYSLDADYQSTSGASDLSAASASLDGWIFAPFGTLRSTAVVRGAEGADATALRLETTYQIASPQRRVTFALGDVQSSSLAWTRSIRMGGVQVRRDFGLRSDLVTQQLLSFNGAAAVPTTVDVFIDNNRTYSTSREAGPFRLEDLPARSGPGEALIVVTDANGRRTTRAVSFYVSQKLLKKGLADYSIEAGRAREGYGLSSSAYGTDGVFSASLRYGVTERLTVEGNLQLKSGLRLAGIGLTTVPFDLAEVSLAVGASDHAGREATFVFGSAQTRIGKVEVSGSLRWAQEGFADLAYATGVDYLGGGAITDGASLLEAPRRQAALSLSVPLDGASSFGVGYVASDRDSSRDELVTASFGRDLAGLNGAVSFYGAHDLLSGDTRAAVGLSMSLGKRRTLRASTSVAPGGAVIGGLYLARTMSDRHGDYGYAAEVQRDGDGVMRFSGQGEYLGRYGKSTVNARAGSGTAGLRVQLDGAVAMAGGAVAFGNRITDSFAIVETGVAGVPVSVHNRPVTATGRGGRSLVTGLQSNRRNRVSVDIDTLPADVVLDATAMDVVPAIGSGVRVTLKGDSEQSALLILRDGAGRVIAAGAVAFLNGGRTEFFVGYDGETLVEGLRAENRLTVRHETGTCTARVAFVPRPGPLQVIEGVECR